MSPTSYQAAPPRVMGLRASAAVGSLIRPPIGGVNPAGIDRADSLDKSTLCILRGPTNTLELPDDRVCCSPP